MLRVNSIYYVTVLLLSSVLLLMTCCFVFLYHEIKPLSDAFEGLYFVIMAFLS